MNSQSTCLPLLPCAVYGLATQNEAGSPLHFFFVSGLRRTPGLVDVREHVAIMRGLQPELARAFERIHASGVRHGFVVLAECAADEAREGLPHEPLLADQIRWQIIRLMRDGHHLINERLGSVEERARLAIDVAGAAIQSPTDLARRRALLARRALAQQRRAHALANLWRYRYRRDNLVGQMLAKAMPVLARRLRRVDDVTLPDTNPVDALFLLIHQAREARPSCMGVIAKRARRKPGRVGAPPGPR